MPLRINIAEGTQSKSATQLLEFLKDAGKTDKDLHIHLDGNAVVLYTKGEEIPKDVMETERTLYSADGKGRNSFLSKDVMGKARIAVYNALANEFSDDVANQVVTNTLQGVFFPPEGNGIKAAPMESLSDLAETLKIAIDAASKLKVGMRNVAPLSIADDKKKDISDENIGNKDINLEPRSDEIDEVKADITVTDDDKNELNKTGSNYVEITLAPEDPSEPQDKSLVDPKDSSADPDDPFAGFLQNNDTKVTGDDADANDADDQPPVQLPFQNFSPINKAADEDLGLDDVSLEDADLKLEELPEELEGTPTGREIRPKESPSDDKKTAPAPSKDDSVPEDDRRGIQFDTSGLDIGEEGD